MKITNEISSNGASTKVELESQDKVYPNLVNEVYDASSIILVNTIDTHIYDMEFLFNGLTNLEHLKLQYFCTENVTKMNNMFKSCNSLTSLNLSNFDTSKVTDMNNMFDSCSSLTSLNLSNFDTSKVTDMKFMFVYCSSLTSLDVSNFNTSNVTKMDCMFRGCESLTSLDLSNFDTSKVTDMSWMFDRCSNLTSLDISTWNFSNTDYLMDIFDDCYSLTDLQFGKNLSCDIDLSKCPLTHESALSVINGLAEVNQMCKVTFNKKTFKTLTAEEKQVAKDKFWSINDEQNKFIGISNLPHNILKSIINNFKAEKDYQYILLSKENYNSITNTDIKALKSNGFIGIILSSHEFDPNIEWDELLPYDYNLIRL